MSDTKICAVCRKRLTVVAFNGSARTSDGLARDCRTCTNARRRQRDHAKASRAEPATQTSRLAAALRQGDVKKIRELITAGMIAHSDWVCETMRAGHLELAEILLECGVPRNISTMAAMGDVLRLQRRVSRIPADARLTSSMEPASQFITPLHVACASDWSSHGSDRMSAQVRIAKILVEHGADLCALARYRGIEGATPLFCACWSSRNLPLVRWLLDQGAIANEGCLWAALGHLQRHGKEAYDIAEVLLDSGLSVNARDGAGRTLLHAFAHQGSHKTVAWLIAHGADVHACVGGRTAAHLAAERNSGPATLVLLAKGGVDLAARDVEGHTPLDIAKLNGKTRLVEWMTKRIHAQRP